MLRHTTLAFILALIGCSELPNTATNTGSKPAVTVPAKVSKYIDIYCNDELAAPVRAAALAVIRTYVPGYPGICAVSDFITAHSARKN